MKAVFAHDHVFVTWQDAIYSPGRLPYAAWGRYLEHFSSLTVVARGVAAKNEKEVCGLSRSDGPGVTFALQAGRRGVSRILPARTDSLNSVSKLLVAADAVIARVPSRLGIRVANMAMAIDRPFALEIVGSALHSLWHHGSIAAKLYAPVLDWQTKSVVARAPAALYVTREYLQKRYPCHGLTAAASNVVIPRPDFKLLEARRRRVAERKGPLCIGFVGTLNDRHKGLDTLLQAVSTLPKAIPWALQVVGEGRTEMWQELAASLDVQAQVHFLGSLPGSAAVREWMHNIDVFVLPSKGGEGLPRAIIEALSCGCLAYATDVGGVSELLTEKCMFLPGDAARLAKLLELAAVDNNVLVEAIDRGARVSESYASDVLEQIRRNFFSELSRQAKRAQSPNS